MRFYELLLEYNQISLLNTFKDKLMNKWKNEGYPFLDEIGEKTPKALLFWIEQYDPTQNKKYMTWIVHNYAGKNNGIQRLEDIPSKVAPELDLYDRLLRKHQLKQEDKIINKIKSLNDLQDLLDKYKKQEIETKSKQEANKSIEQELYKTNQAKLVYNDNEWKIVIPKTEKASCFFGRNTRWCTASTHSSNFFKTYSKQGPLYIILHKPTNERWQWHVETRQYMDENDQSINLDKFIKKYPKITKIILKNFGGLEKVVVKDPSKWFKYLKNPSEEIQLETVKKNGYLIQYIKNPSEKVQLEAVKNNGLVIRFIKNPSEKVQLEAVKNNGLVIQYIKNPSEKVQLEAVKQSPYAIRFIKNPSEKVQLEAVKKDGLVIRFIKNPSEKVQLAAVKKDGYALEYIKNPSEKVQLEAVKKDGYALEYIKNPSEEVQLAAVKQNGRIIRMIKNPSEEIQLKAAERIGSNLALEYIRNPSPKVLKFIRQLK